MDRSFPEPHPFGPDETELLPERDPDADRDDALEREFEERREAAAYAFSHRRRIAACIDQTASRFREP